MNEIEIKNDEDQSVKEILDLFNAIRSRLHSRGIPQLSLDFPIIESFSIDALGYCNYSEIKYNKDASSFSSSVKASYFSIENLEIKIRYDDKKRIFKLKTLLPTFLHELAHTITTPEIEKGGYNEGKGKKTRKWTDVSHGSEFYKNFKIILEVAEELDIFVLPGDRKSKFSIRNLEKYDKVDSQEEDLIEEQIEEEAESYKGVKEDECWPKCFKEGYIEREDERKIKKEEMKKEKMRVTINWNGVKKLVILNGEKQTVKDLIKIINQKYKCKPKKLHTLEGTSIDKDETLRNLEQDSTLIAS